MRIEKWHEMTKRHKEERRKIIEYWKAHQMTQREAAEYLGLSEAGLSKYIRTNNIKWIGKPKKPRRTARPLAPDA